MTTFPGGTAMHAQIEAQREALTALCRRFQVSRLEVFGSAAAGPFDAERSDVDFLVAFQPMAPGEHARAYFALRRAIQDQLQRSVDLVEIDAIRNPYFQASVDRTRVLLYAA